MRRSSTVTTRPTASNKVRTRRASSSVTPGPKARADIPSRTSAGAFGMTRTIRAPRGSRWAIRRIDTPAAIEMTSRPARSAPIPASTVSRTCGLTASRTTSAQDAASALSDPTRMPNRRLTTSRRSALESVANTAAGSAELEASRPASSASAIWPAPMIAIFFTIPPGSPCAPDLSPSSCVTRHA